MSLTKVLAIGLDSADRDVVWRMQLNGHLPNLRRLINRGVWGCLKSPVGLADDGVWPSFAYTCTPGKHGRYFWKCRLPDSDKECFAADHPPDIKPFWGRLGSEGYRVAVIDVPKSPLIKMPNGIQVSDWRVHGRDRNARSYPEGLVKDLIATFGDDDIDVVGSDNFLCCEKPLPHKLHQRFIQSLIESCDAKKRASLALLSMGGWDLFLTVFKEAHCVGHEFWHSVDSRHDRFSELRDSDVRPVEYIYTELDKAIGELVEKTDPNTHIMIFSTLGMGSNYTGDHLLDLVLQRLEPHVPPHLIPRLLKPVKHPFDREVNRYFSQVDHNECSGAININRSIIGESASALRKVEISHWLEQSLLELTDPKSGRKIVSKVIWSDEYYHGDRRNWLPDCFVIWNRCGPIEDISSPKIGHISSPPPSLRSGNHIEGGFYLMAGPRVNKIKRGRSGSIMDVGPTLADLLGAEIPLFDGCSVL